MKGKKMKRIVAIILVAIMLLSLVAFTGCTSTGQTGDSPSNNEIKLTLDNYSDYLTISANVYGDGNKTWSSYLSAYMYGEATGTARVSGISNYEYNDVTVKITIYFSYGNEEHDIPITVRLNKGGSGSGTGMYDFRNGPWANDWIQKYAYYEVTSISGSVNCI